MLKTFSDSWFVKNKLPFKMTVMKSNIQKTNLANEWESWLVQAPHLMPKSELDIVFFCHGHFRHCHTRCTIYQ
jgi:hypothetical protein